MGTPEFAVESLDILVAGNFNVVGVVTVPDKPAGRGQLVQQSPVKKYALEKGLPVLQPEKLKAPEFIRELAGLKADLQIVVAFRMLPEIVWNMPAEGTYNLHASLLPKYRGAAPINWAIINGERESGVTTFKLKHEIDTGNILFQEKVPIGPEDTAGDLHDILMRTGAQMVLKTAKKIEEHFLKKSPLEFIPQNDAMTSHAPKLFKDTCRINWSRPVREIHNLIRGLSPYPAAFTQLLNDAAPAQTIKIFGSEAAEQAHSNPNGLLSTDGKSFLKVYASNGILNITDIQLEGKKRMPVAEFLRGFKIKEGARFF
jgi:methionyl-tRNA formyltransferase